MAEETLLQKLLFLLRNRFICFFAFLLVFVSLHFIFFKSWLPNDESKNLWFYTGLFMVIFSIFFIDPYYTSPKNVITNVIPILLVFFSIKSTFPNNYAWWISVISMLFILIASILAMVLEDKNNSPTDSKNIISDVLKKIVMVIGRGRVFYSIFFLYFFLLNYSIQSFYALFLFIFWFILIIIEPKDIHNSFFNKKLDFSDDQIGSIFGVQSNKMFLTKLHGDKTDIQRFDVVKFKYSMQNSNASTIFGIVFDTYLLNQEKWARILELKKSTSETETLEKNIIYKIKEGPQIEIIKREIAIDRFIGVVIEGSSIGKIKFEYSKKEDDLQEGDLLELYVGEKKLFYQVVNGTTQKKKLEADNEACSIEGEAIQLGEWCNEKLSFQKFGWVPVINSPIFRADTSNFVVNSFKYPQYKLGQIPGTTLPSVIDLSEAVRTHTALLGITGSGKSFLAREIIKELMQDTKIICVDLTGEWEKEIAELKPEKLIDSSGLKTVEEMILKKETESRNKNSIGVLGLKKAIQTKLNEHVKKFAESDKNISIFELPDLSNTSFILEFTQMFMESVFQYAKNTRDKKFCLVLEEAHTVIPETTFLGDLGDYSSNKGLVSKMGQIALQGRKYGVGLLVIAQRTANVSKTVLTQCNTVICFQAFDETSFTFLGNYIGKDMIQALPNLKQYHAIVAGKAMRSNIPMIVDLKRDK